MSLEHKMFGEVVSEALQQQAIVSGSRVLSSAFSKVVLSSDATLLYFRLLSFFFIVKTKKKQRN